MFNTGEKLKAYNIRPVKSLGQNFLADISVVSRIVETADLTREDLVIEIGPGLGVMTEMMAEEAGFVCAVEIDRNLMEPLKVLELSHDNIEIINKDILKTDIRREILDRHMGGELRRVKVVANLPYYITTPIIMKLLEMELPALETMVFMVQKEVGARMVAKPGGKDYGALSVAVQYYSESSIEFTVPPHCFIPRPAVDSCVVKLNLRKEPAFLLEDRDFYFKVVKAAFGQRRKMLVNSLAGAAYLGISKEEAGQALEAMGKDLKLRGETLSPGELGELSNRLLKIKEAQSH